MCSLGQSAGRPFPGVRPCASSAYYLLAVSCAAVGPPLPVLTIPGSRSACRPAASAAAPIHVNEGHSGRPLPGPAVPGSPFSGGGAPRAQSASKACGGPGARIARAPRPTAGFVYPCFCQYGRCTPGVAVPAVDVECDPTPTPLQIAAYWWPAGLRRTSVWSGRKRKPLRSA